MELVSSLLSSFLFLFITCFALLFLKHHYFTRTRSAPSSSPSPSSCTQRSTVLKSYPLVGTLPHFIKNSARFFEWVTDLVVGSPTATATVAPIVITGDPANIEYFLRSRFGNYPKGYRFTEALSDFLGDGIFNADGEPWKLQRKTASFEFNTKSIRAFMVNSISHGVIRSLFPKLSRAAMDGAAVDLQDALERLAFDSVCTLVFNEDPKALAGGNPRGAKFFHAFEEATVLSVARMQEPLRFVWQLKKRFRIGSEKRLAEAVHEVHEYVSEYIHSRKLIRAKQGQKETVQIDEDLLSRFMREGNYSDEFLRDALVSFVLAGRDTTPSALTWIFWVAASRADILEKIREELNSIRAKNEKKKDDIFTLEELKEMHYLHAMITETLRLYPPVPLQQRLCMADDRLPDGTEVRRGWTLMYNSYAMGRMEKIWGEDCKTIKPERWLEGGVFQPKNPFEYPVFHGGPRMCLGRDMAYIQMKAVVACVVERFEMEVAEERGVPELSMSMRMKGGLPMRFKPRHGTTT